MLELKPNFQINRPAPYAPSRGTPFAAPQVDIKRQLQELGIDTNQIDSEVSNEIVAQKSNNLSIKDFHAKLDKLQSQNPSKTDDEIYKRGLELSIDKGYQIEGLDLDAELLSITESISSAQAPAPATTPTPEQEIEDPGALGRLTGKAPGAIGDALKGIREGGDNFIGGAIAGIPSIVANLATSASEIGSKLNVFDKPGKNEFGQKVIQAGEEISDIAGKKAGIDPEANLTKAGEFVGEIAASTALPGGQVKSATKVAGEAGKLISKLASAVNLTGNKAKDAKKVADFATKNNISKVKAAELIAEKSASSAAKLGKTVGLSVSGAEETAKFQAAAEGEVTPTGVALGAVANPLASSIGAKIRTKDVEKILREVVGLNANQVKNNGVSNIAIDAALGVKSLKDSKIQADDMVNLLKGFNKAGNDIYEKGINPKLKEAGEKGTVKLTGLTDEILDEVNPIIKGTKNRRSDGQFDKAENFDKVIAFYKDFEKVTDFNTISDQRAFISGQLRGMKKDTVEFKFLAEIGKRIGSQLDESLELALGKGSGVNDLKRQWAAIQNLKESMYVKVAKELRGTGGGLVDNLGAFQTLKQLSQRDIVGAAQTFSSIKLLNQIRDPSRKINRLMRMLHTGDDAVFQEFTERLGATVLSKQGGETIDQSNIGR